MEQLISIVKPYIKNANILSKLESSSSCYPKEFSIHKISTYLAGNFHSHYRPPFDKLELIEKIRSYGYATSDLMKIIDSSSFYVYALNFV